MDLFNFTKDFIETVNKEFKGNYNNPEIEFKVILDDLLQDSVCITIRLGDNYTMLNESIHHIQREPDQGMGKRIALNMCRELKAFILRMMERKEIIKY